MSRLELYLWMLRLNSQHIWHRKISKAYMVHFGKLWLSNWEKMSAFPIANFPDGKGQNYFLIWTLTSTNWLYNVNWAASREFGTYRLCEQRRFRRACASAQSRQNLRCSLIQAVSHEEPSNRKPDPWPFWMAGHAQLKFVMTECSKTQIRLTGLNLPYCCSCKLLIF